MAIAAWTQFLIRLNFRRQLLLSNILVALPTVRQALFPNLSLMLQQVILLMAALA
jgi:hypothetical protein